MIHHMLMPPKFLFHSLLNLLLILVLPAEADDTADNRNPKTINDNVVHIVAMYVLVKIKISIQWPLFFFKKKQNKNISLI
jgi:hypothetical protein